VDLGVRDHATADQSGTIIRNGRRRAAAIGLVVVAAYAMLAMISGRLSPLARGPLLDSLLPAQAYRWVNPPPDLAATNVKPSNGVFTLTLDAHGVRPQVLVTSDNQATINVPAGAIAAHSGDRSVEVTVTPVDPGTLVPPGDGLSSFGNAYRIEAAYRPSGTKVHHLDRPIDIVLLYPVTLNLQSTHHAIYSSIDGQTWTLRSGSDSLATQQTEGAIPDLGFAQVAGELSSHSPTPAQGSGSNSSRTLAIGFIVGAICLLLVGVGLLLRTRRSE
jgi:hypothetical protein